MKIDSLHPGVSFEDVSTATGFELTTPSAPLPVTPRPTSTELQLLREVIDPHGARRREFS
jgi:hypothetical protein